jgi:hypothetical protein
MLSHEGRHLHYNGQGNKPNAGPSTAGKQVRVKSSPKSGVAGLALPVNTHGLGLSLASP